jgi:hydroxymethylbilane synthase
MTLDRPIRLGTRASALALWQANWTAAALKSQGFEVEIVELTTTGDTDRRPLAQVGGEGVFTKRIQEALLDNEVDLAVHSLKDLPTIEVPELKLAAVPSREDVHDWLISPEGTSLNDLPQGAKVGTGSLRRQAQLLHQRPDLEVCQIRGNVETRLGKLNGGEFDAVVLAAAGVKRLELTEVKGWPIPLEVMLPAVGQAALGLEVRANDEAVEQAVRTLNDEATEMAVLAERSMLRHLLAGCLAPVGGYATFSGGTLKLKAMVLDPKGVECLFHVGELSGEGLNTTDAEGLGREIAEALLGQGAEELIRQCRSQGKV